MRQHYISSNLLHFVTRELSIAILGYYGIQWEKFRGSNNFAANCTCVQHKLHILLLLFPEMYATKMSAVQITTPSGNYTYMYPLVQHIMAQHRWSSCHHWKSSRIGPTHQEWRLLDRHERYHCRRNVGFIIHRGRKLCGLGRSRKYQWGKWELRNNEGWQQNGRCSMHNIPLCFHLWNMKYNPNSINHCSGMPVLDYRFIAK